MKGYFEKPFECLRRKDGTEYDAETIRNWYKARAYVLDKLKEVTLDPDSSNHLHVVVQGDSHMMLSVVRQVALLAHYINYDEARRKNRTVVTIVSENANLVDELKKEEYLWNLLDHCMYTQKRNPVNEDSYIDIEFEIVKSWTGIETEFVKIMSEKDVELFLKDKDPKEIERIEVSKAVLAKRMYDLGTLIDNLPAEDIHCAKRYVMALDVFQHDCLRDPVKEKGKEKTPLITSKTDLSNVFCADCFESRKRGIDLYLEKQGKMTEKEAWANNNEALSKSEHARWVVEKLIMGFRPLKEEEQMVDEQLFGEAKKKKRKRLKESEVHIDLCSYADMRRINPEDLKYNSFLMLAIPAILKKRGIK